MSKRYQLPCPCGRQVDVESSQAGQSVTCSCGQTLQVPTFRQLNAMSSTDATTGAQPARTARAAAKAPVQPARGCAFVGFLMLTLAAAALCAVFVVFRSTIDTSFTLAEDLRIGEEVIDQLTIDETYEAWKELGRVGLARDAQQPYYETARRMALVLTSLTVITGILAVVGLVGTIVTWWRSFRARRLARAKS